MRKEVGKAPVFYESWGQSLGYVHIYLKTILGFITEDMEQSF